ncbi:hypothetical protein [Jeotgalibacillus salarius]|uniref:Geobacillin-26 family protein n=1 Tax=Jeotgalibacillus salarius TaxID=546023 RepID=A0A4Y8LHK2_9BACL|nr:hypothetical protein [Jeotgalibacillus salarius]TFE02306.1 hypothetical protein E2626_06930 [Jeotgalibacillus salarius]
MKKICTLLFVVLMMFPASNVMASQTIIDEVEISGYTFTISQSDEENSFIWNISYQDQSFILSENASNQSLLTGYRDALYDTKTSLITSIIAGCFIIIALTFSFIFFKRNKEERSSPLLLIIGVMVGIAVYTLTSNLSEYLIALKNAEYFFKSLATKS